MAKYLDSPEESGLFVLMNVGGIPDPLIDGMLEIRC